MKITTRRAPAGFSLVELLTVIGIVAVLLALLMPALSEARRNAQAVQCASNMRQLTTAMISYATEFGSAAGTTVKPTLVCVPARVEEP